MSLATNDKLRSKVNTSFSLGRSRKILVVTVGEQHNLWPKEYVKRLKDIGIKCIQLSNAKQLPLLCFLYKSSTIFLVLKSVGEASNIVAQIHQINNIHSIYIQCESSQLIKMRRFASNYMKLDAVFDDETRLLIDIVTNLALFCEQIGDWHYSIGDMVTARTNYRYAQYLCSLAEMIVVGTVTAE